MVLGLGLFALAMVMAVAMGWMAASNSKAFDESKHLNLVEVMIKNGNGK